MNNITYHNTLFAPAPAGHYSQAVEANGFIFVSGQLAIDATGKKYIDSSVAEQAKIILRNIDQILKHAGSSLNNLLSVTIYINDISQWDEVNKIYGEVLGEHKPSRAIVPVNELHFGLKIEIQAIALRPGG